MSNPTPHTPFFMQEADAHYGHAFDIETEQDLEQAMRKWAELHDSDRSFILAHLLYLNLKAHTTTQRLTIQTRDLIDEVAEHLAIGVEHVLPRGAEDEADPEFPDLNDLPRAPASAAGGEAPASGSGTREAQAEIVEPSPHEPR